VRFCIPSRILLHLTIEFPSKRRPAAAFDRGTLARARIRSLRCANPLNKSQNKQSL